MKIALELIKPSPRPIRSTWDEDKMNELAQSLKEQGQIVPIKVRPIDGLPRCFFHDYETILEYENSRTESEEIGMCSDCNAIDDFVYPPLSENDDDLDYDHPRPVFEIVYGHRRVEAARRAGLAEIDAIVEGMEDEEAIMQALIENVQREDMNDLDKAKTILSLKSSLTEYEIAKKTGIDRGRIHHFLTLIQDETIASVFEKGIKEDGVDLLQPVRDAGQKAIYIRSATQQQPELKRALAEKVVRENLSTGLTRRVAESIKAAPTPEAKQRLIERPYSPYTHDADVVREVAKHPERPRKEATGFEWEMRPDITEIFNALKLIEQRMDEVVGVLPDWKRTVDIGKLAPEGLPFFLSRFKRTAGKMHTTARRLEELADWIEREQYDQVEETKPGR